MEYWVDVQKHDARAFKVYTKRAAKELKAEVQVEDLSNVMKPFAIQSRFKFPEEGPKGHFYGPFQDEVQMHENEDYPGELETDIVAFVDPRTADNGIRVVCPEQSFIIDDEASVS